MTEAAAVVTTNGRHRRQHLLFIHQVHRRRHFRTRMDMMRSTSDNILPIRRRSTAITF